MDQILWNRLTIESTFSYYIYSYINHEYLSICYVPVFLRINAPCIAAPRISTIFLHGKSLS